MEGDVIHIASPSPYFRRSFLLIQWTIDMKKFFKRYSLSLLLLLLPSVFSRAQVNVPFTMDESTFYGDYVTTNAKKGNYLWEDGKIRMTSDGLLGAGCGFCWDNRYFTVEISGAPDRVSFSTSTSALATAFDEISWLLEESADGSSWESVWKSSKQTNTVSVELNKKSRFIRLHYGFNYSGYVKDFSVSACHYVKFMDGEREVASFGPFRKDESLASISAPLIAGDECKEFAGWDAKLPAKMSSSDIVLHSLFNKKSFSATLRLADEAEKVSLPDQSLTIICGEPILFDQPACEGFSFKGWSPNLPSMGSSEMDGAVYQAIWSRNKYRLYYRDGDDTISSWVDYGKTPSPIETPTKRGHTFVSWKSEMPAEMPAHDVELFPIWSVNSYLLTVKLYEDSLWLDSLNYGDELVLSTPARRGYRFMGWTNRPEVMPDHDVEFSAQWIPESYRLSVVADGDTLFARDYLYRDIIGTLPAFEVAGYTFKGFSSEVPVMMPDSNVVLTAVFQANKHLLHVVADGETISSDTLSFGESVSMDDYLPVIPEGYSFQWLSASILSMPDHDVTLSGTFVRLQYGLTISDVDSIYVERLYSFGDSIRLEKPAKSGYRLTNWSDLPSVMPAHPVDFTLDWSHESHRFSMSIEETEFFSASYFYGDTIAYPSFPDSTNYRLYWSADLPVVMPDSDFAVSGAWNLFKFKLAADLGTGSVVSDYYQSGDSIRPLIVPEREGYSFDGWLPEIPEIMPDSDFSTKAQWLKNNYHLLVLIEDSVWMDNLVAYQDTIVLNTLPSRVGYSLQGDEIPFLMPADSVVLSYSWRVNIHRLTAESATKILLDTLVEYGSPIDVPIPSLEGYTFVEWTPVLPSFMPDSDLYLFPSWVVNQYGFTILLDGEIVVDTFYAYGDTLRLPDFIDREGYTLTWETSSPLLMPADSLSLSARWMLNEHRLLLMDGDSILCDKVVPFGSDLRINDLSKDGWVFDGWNPTLPSLMPDSDVVAVATWSLPVYNLTVVEGNDTLMSELYVAGSPISSLRPDAREGYSFEWIDTVPEFMPEENVLLRCRYEANLYNFVLTADGDTMLYARYPFGSVINIEGAVPTKTGFSFVGWSDSLPDKMPAQDISLSAEWTPIFYSFVAYDGDSVLTDTLYMYGSKIEKLPEMAKEGHQFLGWDTIWSEMPDRAVSVSAQWKTLEYSITLMLVSMKNNNMLGLPEKMKFTYGETIDIETPVYPGYHFLEWKNDCPKVMPAKNFALVALMEHDSDPTGNLFVQADALPYYVSDRTIHILEKDAKDEVFLIDMHGVILYSGHSITVDVSSSGRYVLILKGNAYDLIIK